MSIIVSSAIIWNRSLDGTVMVSCHMIHSWTGTGSWIRRRYILSALQSGQLMSPQLVTGTGPMAILYWNQQLKFESCPTNKRSIAVVSKDWKLCAFLRAACSGFSQMQDWGLPMSVKGIIVISEHSWLQLQPHPAASPGSSLMMMMSRARVKYEIDQDTSCHRRSEPSHRTTPSPNWLQFTDGSDG